MDIFQNRLIPAHVLSLLFGIFSLGWLEISLATPPRPPAQITLPDNQSGELVILKEKFIPVQIKLNQDVVELETTATLQPLLTGKQIFEPIAAATMLQQRVKEKQAIEAIQQVPLKVDAPGTYVVDIRINGTTTQGGGFSDRLVRYVVLDKSGAMKMYSVGEFLHQGAQQREKLFLDENRKNPKNHPIRLLFENTIQVPSTVMDKFKPYDLKGEQRNQVKPEGPSAFLRKHSIDNSATSWSSQDPITVRGRVVFLDIDGVWKPLVNASINLWDSDFLVDENLGNVASDWDGRWSFSVNNDDGWFQDGRDLYYSFKLDNTRWSTGSCNFLAGAYEWSSSVHNDMSDGTVLDFGDETASTNTNALQVWSTLNLAWNHAVTVGGWDPGKIDGCYPASGTFYNGSVNIEAGDNDGPDSITHEYGHGLMAHAYPSGDSSPGGDHGFGDCNQNQALSWSEGWATGFMLSARPDGTYNWHEGQGGQPIENFSSTCTLGETSEGWVAAALLDFMDANNDDNGGDINRGRNGVSDHNNGNTIALSTILRDTMVGSHHNNVLEFWNSLAGELDATRRPLGQEIMNYNNMSVLAPSSCVATKVATLQERDPESLLSGLRKFRDLTLKNWGHGRELINMYYRNSPEIAVILLRNPDLVPGALSVIKHFSAIGGTVSNHNAYLETMQANALLIPPEVGKSMDNILIALTKSGSPELKADIARVRKDLAIYKPLKIQQVQTRIMQIKAKQLSTPLPVIQQNVLTKSSSKLLFDDKLQSVMKSLIEKK